ncbi:MAG: class I SAM-dependent methyltransferase, partial [Pseudomonadota bacterium]
MKDIYDATVPVAEHRDALRRVRKTHQKLEKRATIRGDTMALFSEELPASLMGPYELTDAEAARAGVVQGKYLNRNANLKRAWNRTQRFAPELLLDDGPKYRVLELSTAHGAQLEVARHYGHEAMGCDFANMVFTGKDGKGKRWGDNVAALRGLNDTNFERKVDDHGIEITGGLDQDWPYRPITEAINLPMTIFDGGKTPYPFDDKSYDVTMCFQAIEHYCHPKDWMRVVDEMCRITTRSIILLLNPVHRDYARDEAYTDAFEA